MNKVIGKYRKSWRISIILIMILAVSTTMFFIQVFSKPTLTISVKLDLYCSVRPWGDIRDVNLETASSLVGTMDNITQTYNANKPLDNFSYVLFFTLNESSSSPINWTYRISDRFDSQGDYEGYVVSSVKAKGRYMLTIELIGYSSDLEVESVTVSKYVDIF